MSEILSDSTFVLPGEICSTTLDSFIPVTQTYYHYPQYDYKYEELRKTILKKLKESIDERNCVLAKIYADLLD